MYVVNVFFKEEYVVWRKREEGGGLVGNFTTRTEAEQYLEDNALELDKHDITQTQIHTLLRLDDATQKVSDIPFLFDCASSKLKVSREWNTKIIKQGGDRFAYLWKMSSVHKATQRVLGLISTSKVLIGSKMISMKVLKPSMKPLLRVNL